MSRANLTIQLDVDVIRRARIIATKRGTSISALVATQLAAVVDEDERFDLARDRALAILKGTASSSGHKWTRDELHERRLSN
jgi:Family of unknown function (DUF6364)